MYFDLEDFKDSIEPSVFFAQDKALGVLKSRACNLIEKKWPFFEHGLSAYYLISTAEASSNLARYDGVRYGYRSEKKGKKLTGVLCF